MSKQPDHVPFKSHRMPEKSVFFDRIVPLALVLLGAVMIVLVLFAFGVLTGIIRWS